ncbi:hypothetical protein PQX77_005672 [Marasmius sp. AFHP31]|nr:hypothetical protein PQX77_005672 [Marasmius sp. AFHP31]
MSTSLPYTPLNINGLRVNPSRQPKHSTFSPQDPSNPSISVTAYPLRTVKTPSLLPTMPSKAEVKPILAPETASSPELPFYSEEMKETGKNRIIISITEETDASLSQLKLSSTLEMRSTPQISRSGIEWEVRGDAPVSLAVKRILMGATMHSGQTDGDIVHRGVVVHGRTAGRLLQNYGVKEQWDP